MANDGQIITLPKEESGALARPVRDTLSEVLNDPTLNKTFGGKDEKLSTAQAGLVSAVMVKMQERLIEHMEHSHERELRLLAGFWRLYKTPVFQSPKASGTASTSNRGMRPKKSPFAGLFTWGNMIGGAAVIIVALSFFYTKITSSYEQQWKNAEADASALRQKLESEQKVNEALQFQLVKAETRAEESEKMVKSLTANAADHSQQLLRAIGDLSQQKGEIAKQVAASTGEKKFQSLYDGAQKELAKLREENAKLLERAIKAEANLKAKS